MLNIGDYAVNPKTGHLGKVIGYGHQVLKGSYETTLKVLVIESGTYNKRGFVEEDLCSAWIGWLEGQNFHLS